MRKQFWVACCVSIFIVMGSIALSQSKPDVGVSLTSLRPEYVIGEPILLKVIVKNISSEQITAEWAEKRVRVFVSEDGKQFQGYLTKQ